VLDASTEIARHGEDDQRHEIDLETL